jgi:hypothetical protein
MSARNARYKCTAKGKAAHRRYVHSPKGKSDTGALRQKCQGQGLAQAIRALARRQGSEGKSYGAIQSKTSKARRRYNNSLTPIRWRSGGTPTRKYVITSFAVGWGERHTQTLQRTSS